MSTFYFTQRQESMFDSDETEKIRQMVVYIAGAGGLGTHQAQELQRIGVKKIYLVDSDQVEVSNLNRQILYGRLDLGQTKVYQAKEVLDDFNLGTEVVALQERIGPETILPPDVQIVFDALDNFKSRMALEEVAARHGLPLIHGGVRSCYGQVATILPGQTLKLADIVGELHQEEQVKPAYSPVVAVVAATQVIEGVKVLLGRDDTLVNSFLVVDLRHYSFELFQL